MEKRFPSGNDDYDITRRAVLPFFMAAGVGGGLLVAQEREKSDDSSRFEETIAEMMEVYGPLFKRLRINAAVDSQLYTPTASRFEAVQIMTEDAQFIHLPLYLKKIFPCAPFPLSGYHPDIQNKRGAKGLWQLTNADTQHLGMTEEHENPNLRMKYSTSRILQYLDDFCKDAKSNPFFLKLSCRLEENDRQKFLAFVALTSLHVPMDRVVEIALWKMAQEKDEVLTFEPLVLQLAQTCRKVEWGGLSKEQKLAATALPFAAEAFSRLENPPKKPPTPETSRMTIRAVLGGLFGFAGGGLGGMVSNTNDKVISRRSVVGALIGGGLGVGVNCGDSYRQSSTVSAGDIDLDTLL